MLNIKEIALKVASEMPQGFIWSESCGHESGILIQEAIDFAEALIAELAKGNEPVYQFRPERYNWIDCSPVFFESWRGEKRIVYHLPPTASQIEQETAEAWKPIETAPKDGTKILGWCLEFGARETKMNFYGEGSIGYANWLSGKGPKESGWDWTEPKNGWGFDWKPTHWKPLPTPPKRSMEGV